MYAARHLDLLWMELAPPAKSSWQPELWTVGQRGCFGDRLVDD